MLNDRIDFNEILLYDSLDRVWRVLGKNQQVQVDFLNNMDELNKRIENKL